MRTVTQNSKALYPFKYLSLRKGKHRLRCDRMTNIPDHDLVRLAAAAFEIARGAGRVVMKKRNQSMQIQCKIDGSPATAAD